VKEIDSWEHVHRNRYDVLVGRLEREVRSDPGRQRDLDAMREKARLAHNRLRQVRQELERLRGS
jgi:hypothetical protein